jgi:hypothetical protein
VKIGDVDVGKPLWYFQLAADLITIHLGSEGLLKLTLKIT